MPQMKLRFIVVCVNTSIPRFAFTGNTAVFFGNFSGSCV
jgi:hypothetical protein